MDQNFHTLLQGVGPAKSTAASGKEQALDSWNSALGAIAHRAFSAARDIAPQVEELTAPLRFNSDSPSALEEGSNDEPHWTSWAKNAAEQARQRAVLAAEQAQRGLSQGLEKLEKATTADWSEQVKTVQVQASTATAAIQDNVSWGLEMATNSVTSAGAVIEENGIVPQQAVMELSDGGLQPLGEPELSVSAKDKARQAAQQVRENVAAAAGIAKGAQSNTGSHVSAAASPTSSPMNVLQFFVVFGVGIGLVALALNFLPIIPIAPKKFAMLFTIGSMTMLTSFALLLSPLSLFKLLTHHRMLPFSITYCSGLLGVQWATIIKRSFVMTVFFAVLQALSLIYFVWTGLPGGRATLGLLWRLRSRSARNIT